MVWNDSLLLFFLFMMPARRNSEGQEQGKVCGMTIIKKKWKRGFLGEFYNKVRLKNGFWIKGRFT